MVTVLISVVVPTYNERDNIVELIRRIDNALKGIDYEVVVVDDNSPDGTADVAEGLSKDYPVRVVRRPGKLGLATAVLDGVRSSRGDYVVVMDADLQHPPEVIPKMYEELIKGYDIVIASRYVVGGSVGGWGLTRRLISKTAILIAKLLIPRVRGIEDPISGFFMFRKEVLEGVSLSPKGFKILLEVLVKGRYSRVSEVPYTFGVRVRGTSKLSSKELINYITHLLTLTPYKTLLKFLVVGSIGTLVNLGVLYVLRYFLSVEHLIASALSIEASIINNYILHELWTFKDRRLGSWLVRLLKFHGSTALAVTTQYVVSQLLHYVLGVESIISQFVGILLGFVINYILSTRFVWRRFKP
ncbi:MAG: glycosyltransferase family 2 protein [Sulfolobales archaeon]